MQYKLPKKHRGYYNKDVWNIGKILRVPREIKILDVLKLKPNKKNFPNGRVGYDIKTTTNNYFCKGVLVHNSLGIIYYYDGGWRVNTRGRFDSPQAKKGLEILKEKYDLSHIDKSYTLLVEILTQEFKIIIDYGEDKLVLLSAFGTPNNRELKDSELQEISKQTNLPMVESYDYNITQLNELRSTLTKDFEGFVIRYEDNLRIKIKSDEYMKVALLVENLTPLRLWKNMKNGKVKEDVLILIPEEFKEKAKKLSIILEKQYKEEKQKRINEYNQFIIEVKEETGLNEDDPLFRKEMGMRFKRLKYKNSVFLIMDKKEGKMDFYLMECIRPTENEFKELK
jgi:hypothetical protein